MRVILFCALVSLLSALRAQDQLFKKDNTKLDVKILEINPTEIKYKLFTYQDGPLIIISKKDVALIIYQNGTHEVINTPSEIAPLTQTVIIYSDDFKSNKRKNNRDKDSLKTKNSMNLQVQKTSVP